MLTRRRRELIAFMVMTCMLGLAACDQQPGRGDRAPKISDRQESAAASPAHPDVPGRSEPCLRPGGLEKSGYPCEPTPPGKATSESSGSPKAAAQPGKKE